jgi:glycosyltransferase involved in cell wall biosynthesis
MNILVFNWQDIANPLSGGAEVHLHEVFGRIAGTGNRVTLYCSSYPGAAAEEEQNGIRVIREGGRSTFNFLPPITYRQRFRDEGFDIVVDDMNKIPFFTPLYVQGPLVCVTHHLFGRSIFRETNPVIGGYVYSTERAALALFRSRRVPFIVGSPSTRDELVAHGCRIEDITVVPYAVDHAVHRPTGVPRESVPLVGYFGRLKRYKSVDHLLHAFSLVRAAIPRARLVIVGDGDDRPRLESVARNLGIGDFVEFAGFVPVEKKIELLQRMWCKAATSAKEGWGLTVLEANACGTPVVASNVPGLRDAVRDGETGLLYPYGDVSSLADAILRLLRDGPLRERLGRAARAWALEFTWERAAGTTLDLLKRYAEAS